MAEQSSVNASGQAGSEGARAASNWRHRWRHWLDRLRSPQPITDDDLESIHSFSSSGSRDANRAEVPLQGPVNWIDYTKHLADNELTTYRTSQDALTAHGYGILSKDDAPPIEPGLYGEIFRLFKLARQPSAGAPHAESGKHLRNKHLALAKVLHYDRHDVFHQIGVEYAVLRALNHEHIVSMRCAFAVANDEHISDPSWSDTKNIWIVLEYANAGDLEIECVRHQKLKTFIPESGCRYYMSHVCKGLAYMHDHQIVHQDLHSKNVLLKYNPDGTKTAMICDFGGAALFAELPDPKYAVMEDVDAVATMLNRILPHSRRSDQANHLIASVFAIMERTGPGPSTVPQLLQHPWFTSGPSIGPIPKEPTPLLRPAVVQKIGYLQPMDAAGTTGTPTDPVQGPRNLPEHKRRDERRRGSLMQRLRRAVSVPTRAAVRGVRRAVSREAPVVPAAAEGIELSEAAVAGGAVGGAPAPTPPPIETLTIGGSPTASPRRQGTSDEPSPESGARRSGIRGRLHGLRTTITSPFRSSRTRQRSQSPSQ